MIIWMLVSCKPATTVVLPPPTSAQRTEWITRDEVTLVGDVYEGDPGAPAVLLLHMTPVGGWNRTDWPAEFIDAMADKGWWVVALDRRGAGESGGVAEDAFVGDAGRYDVEATTRWLQTAGVGSLAIVGASNGTTSALDYAAWAGGEGLLEPVALGFMTGGTYTETQTSMSAVTVPSVFTFSTAERAWSAEQEGANRQLLEYENGAHGTHMFAAEPGVTADLVGFLDGVL